jgi:hypothetical protein
MVAYLDEDDVCACFCEGARHGLADASGAACDEGGLAGEGEELLDCRHSECVEGKDDNCKLDGIGRTKQSREHSN